MPNPTDIELSVKLSPTDIKKSAQELGKSLEDIFQKNTGDALNSKLKNLQQQISATAGKANQLVRQMEALEDTKIPTAEYVKAQAEFDKAMKQSYDYSNKVVDKVRELKSRMAEVGQQQIPTQAYQDLADYIEKAEGKLEKLGNASIKLQQGPQTAKVQAKLAQIEAEAERINGQIAQAEDKMAGLAEKGQAFTSGVNTEEYQRLQIELDGIYAKGEQFANALQEADNNLMQIVNTGQAFTLGTDTDEYTKLSNQLADVNNKSRVLVERWNEQNNVEQKVSNTNNKLAKSTANLGKSMRQTASHTNRVIPALKKLVSHTKNYGKHAKNASNHTKLFNVNLKKMGWSFIKAMIGVRGMYMLFRKFRQALIDGVKNIVLFEGESGKLNKSLSAIQSSLATLKNSLGTVLAPLINAFAPAITRIIDLLTTATNKVAMFMAAFTGQKTYLVADKVQKNFAESLSETAKNAKKAEKALKGYLSPLDEINQYQTNKDDEEDGGLSTGTFSEIPIDPKFLAWLDEIKKKLQDIIDRLLYPFKKAWEEMGNLVKSTWIAAWDAVKAAVWDVLDTFLEVWDSAEHGVRFVKNLLQIVIDIGNWVHDIAVAFKEAWDENERGKKLIESIFDALNSILELVHTVGESMREVWNSGFGKDFIADLLEIQTNIDNIITGLATGLKEAWESNGIGTAITQDMANIILVFTDTLNKITASLAEWAEDLDFKPLFTALDELLKAVEPFAENVGTGLLWFFEEVLEPLGKWTIEDAIPAFLKSLSGALDLVSTSLEVFKPYGKWFWEEFLEPIVGWEGGGLVVFLEDLGGIFSGLSEKIKNSKEAMEKLEGFIKGYLVYAFEMLFGKAADVIMISSQLIKHWEDFKRKAELLWNAVVVIFKYFGRQIKEGVEDIKNNITESFERMKDRIRNSLNDIKNHFQTFKDNVVTIVRSIWDGIKGHLNNIIGGFEGLVNKIINGINSMIDKLNTVSWEIPDWVPVIGGNRFGFDISHLGNISIPRLAEGAVIPPNKQFLAMLGDQTQGTNIETPLDTMIQAFKQALGDMGNSAGGIQTLNLVLPNKKLVAQYAVEGGRIIQTSTGRNPFDLL